MDFNKAKSEALRTLTTNSPSEAYTRDILISILDELSSISQGPTEITKADIVDFSDSDYEPAGAIQALNLGTASQANEGDFATASQGSLADSALQPGDNVSELNNDAGYLTEVPV